MTVKLSAIALKPLTVLIAFLSLSFLSTVTLAVEKETQSYVVAPKLDSKISALYAKNGFKFRHSIADSNPLDFYVVYSCKINKELEHLRIIYVCDRPSEEDIKSHVFLMPVPSPIDQLNLAQLILTNDLDVAVIYSKNSEIQYRYLKINKHDSVRLTAHKSYGSFKFNDQIKRMIKKNDVVLALVDDSIFNSSTLRALILNTYRDHKPVFGPNTNFVKSGSLASLYISQEAIAKRAIQLVAKFEADEYLPGVYFPCTPEVKTNPHVANAFSLTLNKPEDLSNQLAELAEQPLITNEIESNAR